MKLTRQGVRDLNNLGPKKPKPDPIPNNCPHRRMREHCLVKGKGCGHWECPDCGLSWDDASEC